MKPRSLFAMVVMSFVLVPSLASARANVRVELVKPPVNRPAVEDLWRARVVSDTVADAWFEGFVFEASRGQVFYARSRPFRLAAGTRVYQYRDVTVEKTDVAQGYEAFVTRTGTLPHGTYEFKLVLQPFGIGDSNRFEVTPSGAPRLVSPRNGDTVTARYPQFVWTPPSPTPRSPVTYELKIWEVMPGQTPEEATRSNPPWFESKGHVSPSFSYPTNARQWPDSGHWCWQVTAKPGGRSEVSEFWRAPTVVRRMWWQCNRDKSHFWQGTESERKCPVNDCPGGGEEFVPPALVNLYWNGDSLIVRLHVKQELTLKNVRVVVEWVAKDGRQAADAVVTREFDPPQAHQLCDTLAFRLAWPGDFSPTGSIRPPAKSKLNLEKTKVRVLVNGQQIAMGRRPDSGPPE